MYHGDFALGSTFDIKFTTRSFSTGAPTTLAGTPVISAYPNNSTTELTAGITLTVDFDARTGLHNVRVVATSGNGYATATNYTLVITTGTVGGVSVVGECIGSFSLEARSAVRPTVAGRTLDVSTGGEAGVDWANIGSPTTTVGLSGTTVASTQKVDIETIKTNPVVNAGTVTFPTTATLASTTNITGGTITTATNLTNAPTNGDLTATMKTSVTTAASAATPAVTVSDKTGFSLSTAGILAIWHQALAAIVTASTIGKLIIDFLDAAISSRSTLTQTEVTGGVYTVQNSACVLGDARIANLDATVSSRATQSQVTGGAYSVQSSSCVLGDARIANLDATVSSRNATTPPTVGAIADQVWEEAIADHSGTGGSTAAALAGATAPSAAVVADAVWDEAIAGHLGAGSTGEALNAAGAAGDPWITTLPGSYTGSQAGKVLADVLTDTAEIGAIKAKTDNLPASPASVSDIPTANQNADALLDRSNGVETGYTLRQAQRLQLAALAGKLSGAATSTVTIRNAADTANVIVATVDADGNRTAVTLTP